MITILPSKEYVQCQNLLGVEMNNECLISNIPRIRDITSVP